MPFTNLNPNPTNKNKILIYSICALVIPLLISCADFVDESHPTPEPAQPTPENAPKPIDTPAPKPNENDEQRNWRLCEAERIWAFNARIIDSGTLQIFQNRNFAPVFNEPGVRQSQVEGWYPCKLALEANGFIPSAN